MTNQPNPNMNVNPQYSGTPPNMCPCKYCKQPIDVKAKICPYCRKKQKTSGCLIAFLIVFAFFVFITILGAIGSKNRKSESTSVDPISTNSSTNESNPDQGEKDKSSQSATDASDFAYEVTNTNFNYYTTIIGSVQYNGIVEITNTGNCNIYLDDCTFDLEDNDGHLLQTDNLILSCPKVIAPGEKGYFYNNLGANIIDSSVSLDNGVNLVPTFKVEEAKKAIVDYEVSDTQMREDNFGYLKFTGRVTNSTEEDCNLLSVYILYKDAEGKVIMIDSTTISELEAGATKSFESSSMFGDSSVKKEDIASFDVIARKNVMQF